MRAISLWQPWASAVALGLKRIETRHWYAAYRGPLVIHAAKRWTAEERGFHAAQHVLGLMPATLPLGALVAVVMLVDCRTTDGIVNSIPDEELEWGNYGHGRYGWLFEDIRPLPAPIPYKGHQSFFDVPDDVFPEGFVTHAAELPL